MISRGVFVLAALAVLLLVTEADAGRRRNPPVSPNGVVSYDGNGYLTGCAVDGNQLPVGIQVHLYVKVPASTPGAVFVGPPVDDYMLFLEVKTADLGNENLNLSCALAVGDHGYRFIIPPAYRNQQPQTFYVWAIDSQGTAPNVLLHQPGDPSAYAVDVTVGPLRVIGALDQIQEEAAAGWALDPDTEASPISVHVYVNGAAGAGGTYVGQALADGPRSDLNDWGFEGDHGFQFPLPSTDLVDAVSGETFNLKDGKLREFWVHGIDPNGPNFALDPEPKHYALGDGIEVVGGPEVVFDYDVDSCELYDVPDLPARAWRDALGNVNLIAAHRQAPRAYVGPDFDVDSLVRDCSAPLELTSSYEGTPESFNNAEWLASTYSPDGSTVYGLVHNEYHGHFAGVNEDGSYPPFDPSMCAGEDPGNGIWCWYNSITAVVRNAIGEPFVDPPAGTSRLVATLPYQYDPNDDNARGYFSPSNIHHNVYSLPEGSPPPSPSNQFQPGDGLYYVLVSAADHPAVTPVQEGGACLLRTDDLSDPARWKAWNGFSFAGSFVDPYPVAPTDPEDFVCAPVFWGFNGVGPNLPLIGGLTWNTHLEKFVAVGATKQRVDGDVVDGIFYATSSDLEDWEGVHIIMEVPVFDDLELFDTIFRYATLIDHDDETRNFEKSDATAYLYVTRTNTLEAPLHFNRDLVRYPIRFRDAP